MVGIVPSAVVNASMNRLQAITIPAIIVLVVFVFAIVIFFIVSENRRNLAAKDTEILYREELFGILTSNSEDIYFIVDDGDYKVTYVSPNIEKALGLREEDIRANIHLVDELAASPDTVRIIDKFSEIDLGAQKQFEREYIHSKTGECLWFLVTVFHTKINDDKKYVIILSDRSRERRMNQTLAHALPAYYIISSAEASSNLARFDGIRYGYRAKDYDDITELYKNSRSEGFGAEVKRRIMLGTFALSSGYYDAYYKKALQVRTLIVNDYNRIFEQCDCILSPVAPTTAYKIGEKTANPLEMYLGDIYTVPVNIAGVPSLSMPCDTAPDGLPVGMQLIGKPFSEPTLYRLGYAYERAQG